MDVDDIVATIRDGDFSTRDLVRISCALAKRGTNTTSMLGQYGEKLVAAAYGGTICSFDQKGYDVDAPIGKLQVKTYTSGNRPGVIRTFAYDVITLKIDPTTADVVSAWRYDADELYKEFYAAWDNKLRHINKVFAAFSGRQEDRFERGWSIGTTVHFTDVTHLFSGLEV